MVTLLVYLILLLLAGLAVLACGLVVLVRSAPVNVRAAGYAAERLVPILARTLGATSAPTVTVGDPSQFIKQLRAGRLDRVQIDLGRCVRSGFSADGVVAVASGVFLRTAAVVRGEMSSLRLQNLEIRFVGASAGGLTVNGGGSVRLTDITGPRSAAARAEHAEIALSSVKFGKASVATVTAVLTEVTGLGAALARAARAEVTLASTQVGKVYFGATTAKVTDIAVPVSPPGVEAAEPHRPSHPRESSITRPTLGTLQAQLSAGDFDGLDFSMEIAMSNVLLEPVSRDDSSANGPSATAVTVDGRCDYAALNDFLKKRRVPVAVGPSGRGSPFLRLKLPSPIPKLPSPIPKLPSPILDGVDARVTASGDVVAVEPVAPSDGLWAFVPDWVLRDQEKSWTVRKVVRNLPSGLALGFADTDRHSIKIRAHGESVRILSTAPPRLQPDRPR